MEEINNSQGLVAKKANQSHRAHLQEIGLPKALDNEYYRDNIIKCDKHSKNWYRWTSLYLYADKVKAFYIALIKNFNATLHQPLELPSFTTEVEEEKSLETLARELEEQERKLYQTFDKDKKKLDKKCDDHVTLQELRKFAGKSWLLYQNLTTDNFYRSIVNFKTRNTEKNWEDDRDVSLLFMGHIKTKNFVKTKLNKYFAPFGERTPFKQAHPSTYMMYETLNAEELFDELMDFFNGYKYSEKEEWFNQNLTNVKDEKAKRVIDFYKHYPDTKYVYKKLFYITECLNKDNSDCNINSAYIDKLNNRDLYEVALNYLKEVTELLEMASNNDAYSFVIKDCKFLQNKLTQAVYVSEKYHEDMLEFSKRAKERFAELMSGLQKK